MATISRHKVNGTVYDLMDATARESIEELQEEIEELQGAEVDITSSFSFTSSKRINADDGTYQGSDSFDYMKATSGYVKVSDYKWLRLAMMSRTGGNLGGAAFYSAKDEANFIAGVQSPDTIEGSGCVFMPVRVPEGAVWMRTTYWSDTKREELSAPAFSCVGIKNASYDFLNQLNKDLVSSAPGYYLNSIKWIIDNATPADADENTGVDGQTIISKITNRYIKLDGSTINTNANCKSLWIRLPDTVRRISVTGNATNGTYVCLLKTNSTALQRPAYATGFFKPVEAAAGRPVMLDVPADGKFLYVNVTDTSETDRTPVDVVLYETETSDKSRVYDLTVHDIAVAAYEQAEATTRSHKYIVYTNSAQTAVVWSTNEQTYSVLIPVKAAKQMRIRAVDSSAAFAFLASDQQTIGESPEFATGYAHQMVIQAGTNIRIGVPSDAKFLYVRTMQGGNDITPYLVRFYEPKEYKARQPLFCFVDDDGKADALNWLEKVVDATQIPISIALITGVVGSSTFITWDDVRRLKNKGFNFVNHTNGTANLTTLTEEQVTESFQESQRLMEQHGLPDSNVLVLPNGATNDTVTAIIKKYFTSAVSTQIRLNLPPINTFYVPRVSLDTNSGGVPAYVNKLSEWKEWVDKTISLNGLCIFYGHAYREDYTAQKRIDYIGLVRYIAQNGGEIVSLPEALRRFKNRVEGDVTVPCE